MGKDRQAVYWNLETKMAGHRWKLPHEEVRPGGFFDKGRRAIVLSGEFALIYDTDSGQKLKQLKANGRSWCYAVSPSQQQLCLGFSKEVLVLDVETLRETARFAVDSCSTICFSANGELLCTGGSPNVEVWQFSDTSHSPRRLVFRGHGTICKSATFTPDGRLLITGSGDKTLRFWNVATQEEITTLRDHQLFVDDVLYINNPPTLLSLSSDAVAIRRGYPTKRRLSIVEVDKAAQP